MAKGKKGKARPPRPKEVEENFVPVKKQANKDLSLGERFTAWYKGIGRQLKAVTWPSKEKTKRNTATVIVLVLVITLMILFFDKLVQWVFDLTGFYTIGEKNQVEQNLTQEEIDKIKQSAGEKFTSETKETTEGDKTSATQKPAESQEPTGTQEVAETTTVASEEATAETTGN